MAVILLLLTLTLLAGCAAEDIRPGKPVLQAVPFVTKETGELTIPRQAFVDTWASTQVLFDAWMASEASRCAGPCADRRRCERLPETVEQGRVIKMTVDAKLRNPEATLDWDNIVKLLGLIAKVVL